MGYIYKITNTINNKVYIGQTVKTVQKRFTQHKNNSNKPYFSQIILYKAFNKYGIENFICEEIEEVDNSLLDERERYWIEYYDSYFNGYNSILGGRAIQLYNWDIDDIIEKYLELKSARKVAKYYGCDHSTIDNILNINNVHRFTQAEQKAKTIIMEKENKKFVFSNSTEAAQWIMDNNLTKSTERRIVRQGVTDSIKKGRKLHGYKIYYGE